MNESIAGKLVSVTGADGFIGSHLVQLLVEKGAKVRALVYYNSWNEIGWLKELPQDILKKVEVFHGDIRDRSRVVEFVQNQEYVFHLSSLIAIPYSYVAAESYVQTNVIGALNIAEALKNSKSLKRLLHVSTSEVYGTAQYVPIDEKHPLVGQSPYSASKIAADKMIESYHRSFSLPVVTARPFNTFGPRQTSRAVIPTIATQLLAKVPILKLGATTPTRDFNYVTDTADGMLSLALCGAAEGRTVNIGTGEEWSIAETAKLLMQITGHEVEIVCENERIRPEKSEVNRLLSDNTLITDLTSWKRQVSFQVGLRNTVDWLTTVKCDNLNTSYMI
ncbi:MAG: NAD-dependent dehydratase [Bdellovibrio sp. CG12_big_fil_rev_8_21_14_0_65_39_13]|nr:MAG: NAD-dependent dehydratase [Bdellovibrio sp. CG22_combo_CG10-13_8_21_14_all_39_27]PIQ62801.1 MAG: NAD-dependent dehydratase [Bdellovibrio sp. CG12_big_fil_rev_8_21_14_0_65_39_13]PIR32541.1 MAG: NAD-dependent dehydratase [Bdellovibrio sp. CG11_big_fil_rev_8_21_14_0_20_39_38]